MQVTLQGRRLCLCVNKLTQYPLYRWGDGSNQLELTQVIRSSSGFQDKSIKLAREALSEQFECCDFHAPCISCSGNSIKLGLKLKQSSNDNKTCLPRTTIYS